jgi:putative aldouronate transport system substrate-binding protein
MTTKAKEANYVATYQLLGREDKSYLAIKFKEAKEQIAYASTLPRFLVYNSLITAPDGFYLTDFENYVNQQLIAFVYGDRPISEYDAFIKELYDIYGFGDYLKACDTQMRAFGYIK